MAESGRHDQKGVCWCSHCHYYLHTMITYFHGQKCSILDKIKQVFSDFPIVITIYTLWLQSCFNRQKINARRCPHIGYDYAGVLGSSHCHKYMHSMITLYDVFMNRNVRWCFHIGFENMYFLIFLLSLENTIRSPNVPMHWLQYTLYHHICWNIIRFKLYKSE